MSEQSKRKTTTQPAAKKKTGRPLFSGRLEADVVRLLEEAFALGCSDLESCLYADIGKTAFYKYQAKHPAFAERKELLQERPVLQARNSVIQAMKRDGNLALKYLERKRRKEFALRTEVDAELSGNINISLVSYADAGDDTPQL